MRTGIVVMAFVVGFCAGTVSLRRAGADVTAARARYQYQCVTKLPAETYDGQTIAKLNQLGGEGWRLLDARRRERGGDVYCFERTY
jgi:hypothetical protein